jgi:hypothetical protein
MMARSLKAVAAAAQAAKDRQFRAFQKELGLSLDNDGELLAPSTPRRLPHGAQWLNLLSNLMGGHRGSKPPRWIRTLLIPSSHSSPSLADVGLQLAHASGLGRKEHQAAGVSWPIFSSHQFPPPPQVKA